MSQDEICYGGPCNCNGMQVWDEQCIAGNGPRGDRSGPSGELAFWGDQFD